MWVALLRRVGPGLVKVLVNKMTPLFEPVEDTPNCVDDVVKDNDLPGSALGIE